MLYPIGTQFKTRHKNPRLCTVIDIHTTYDSAGNKVKIRYVSTHDCLGQQVIDYDVVQTTIDMGLIK